MKKLNDILKFSFEFSKNHYWDYCKLLVKPILLSILGIITVLLCYLNPWFAILAVVVGIPAICWAFWRSYVISFSINRGAYNAIKSKEKQNLKKLTDEVNQGELALFLLYCAFITLIMVFIIALFAYLIKSMIIKILITSILTILMVPFLCYQLQAFFYKKPEEKYNDLFLNCYKYMNKDGILIVIIFGIMNVVAQFISGLIPILGLILSILFTFFFTIFYYSAGSIWYCSRTEGK